MKNINFMFSFTAFILCLWEAGTTFAEDRKSIKNSKKNAIQEEVIIKDDFEKNCQGWFCLYKKDIQANAMKINTDFHFGEGKQSISITSSGKHIALGRVLNHQLTLSDKIVFDFYLTGKAIPKSLIIILKDKDGNNFVRKPLYKKISKAVWTHLEIPVRDIGRNKPEFLKVPIKKIYLGATPIKEDSDKNLTFIIDNFKIVRSKQNQSSFVINNKHKAFIAAFKKNNIKTTQKLLKYDIDKIGGIDSFMNIKSGLAKHRTSVAVFYDDKKLYIKFKCYDKEPQNIIKKYKHHDDPVYFDDDFEVFIDPGNGNYYQFLVNPIKTMAEAKGTKDYLSKEYGVNKLDWQWNANWSANIEIKKDSWDGVISIPLSEVGIKITDTPKINICRNYRGGKESSSLFIRRIDWHNPEEWGNLVFIDSETPLEYFRLEQIGNLKNLNFSFEIKHQTAMNSELRVLHTLTNNLAKKFYTLNINSGKNFSIPYSLEEKKSELVFSLKNDKKVVFRNFFPLLFTKDGFIHNVQTIYDNGESLIWIENPSFKVLPQDKVNKISLSKEVNVSLAKNEYEPFQLVITPSATLLNKEISFIISNLVGEGTNAGEVISKDNITWNPEDFLDIKSASSSRTDSFSGKWPDPLLLEQPFKLKSLNHQPFWFSIYSGKNTKAGIYKGTIKIMVNGKEYSKFALKVKIWNFTLPNISYMNTFAIYEPATKLNISNQELLKTIKSHKMSPGRIYNSGDFEKIYGYDSNFVMLFSPSLFGVGDWKMRRKFMFKVNGQEKDIYSKEFKDHWTKLIKEKCEELKKKKILNKFYFWVWDEPWYTADPKLLEKVAFLAKMVKEAEPELKIMTGGNERMGDKALSGQINAWITDLYIGGGSYEPEMAKRLKAQKQETWCYHNNLYLINVRGIYPRLLSYILLKYDIDGYIFWNINKWIDWKTGQYYSNLHEKLENNSGRCGDGLLLYYDKDKKKIISSLRWELLRDSFEDYDYYSILKQKLTEAEKNKILSRDKIEVGKELLKYPDKLIKSYRSLDHITQKDIYSKRKEIGEFIDQNLRF